MTITPSLVVLSLALGGVVWAVPVSAQMPACTREAAAALKIPKLTIESAAPIAAANGLPEFCEVLATLETDGEGAGPNTAGVRLRLPVNWNRKFLFFGVGGEGGSRNLGRMATEPLRKGYAMSVTDTGHRNTDQPNFALNDAKLVDYLYRAAHQVTLASKALVTAYYAADAVQRSYMMGCSNGGRMGLMEAMRYPDDFDGIIASAPYMDLHVAFAWYRHAKIQLDSADAYVPPASLAIVDRVMKNSCDAADGVKDGLIQNPGACDFTPDVLVCTEGRTTDCLPKGQVETLKKYWSPVVDSKGRMIFPGASPTDLSVPGGITGWAIGADAPALGAAQPWAQGRGPSVFGGGILKTRIFRDSSYPSLTLPVGTNGVVEDWAVDRFDARTGIGFTDDPSRLDAFVKRNGKLLIDHGWADQQLSPYRTVMFYEDLAARTPGGYEKLHENVRLFMVPGMLHCSGGPGPNSFDSLTALENWVEQGQAPNAIVASHFPNAPQGQNLLNAQPPPADAPGPVADRTMPLCPFPEIARYTGSGNVNLASNWSCSDKPSLLEVGAFGALAGLGHAN